MTHHPRHAAAPGRLSRLADVALWTGFAMVWASLSIGTGIVLAMTLIGPWL